MSKAVQLGLSLGLIAGLLGLTTAFGRSTGITGVSGMSGVSCSQCHLTQAPVPTVSLTGPLFVRPDESALYEFIITGGNEVAGGLNVATDAGTLAVVDAGTQLIGDELTHTAPQTVNNDLDNVWQFEYTAPATAQTTTLFAAGNSVNLDGNTSGDAHDTTTLDVEVRDQIVTFADFGDGVAGSGGFIPHISGMAGPVEGGAVITVRNGLGGAFGLLWIGVAQGCTDGLGGKFLFDFSQFFLYLELPLAGASGVPGDGTLDITMGNFSGLLGLDLYLQYTALDPGAANGVSFSNGTKMELR